MKKAAFCILLFSLLFPWITGDKYNPAGAFDRYADGCASIDSSTLAQFAADLENIRQDLKIPVLSAAVVCDRDLFWSQGFGFAVLENQGPATPDTPYGLASVTKPLAAVLFMQLVEEGVLDLDIPVSEYGIHFPEEGITLRHLLTHTSEGVPETVHEYNGNRYAYLSGIIERAIRRSFAELFGEHILLPLGMTQTAFNPFNVWDGGTLINLGEYKLLLGLGKFSTTTRKSMPTWRNLTSSMPSTTRSPGCTTCTTMQQQAEAQGQNCPASSKPGPRCCPLCS